MTAKLKAISLRRRIWPDALPSGSVGWRHAGRNRDILTRLLQGKGDAAHEAAVAANVAMLMRLHGQEDLKANAQAVLDVLRNGTAYDRVHRTGGKRVNNAKPFLAKIVADKAIWVEARKQQQPLASFK